MPPPRSVYKLLAIVLQFRETQLSQHRVENTREDKHQLEKLLSFNFEELETLAKDDIDGLLSLVQAALRADPSLTPRDFVASQPHSLTSLVIKWQLKATQAALARRDTGDVHSGIGTPRQAFDVPPPPSKRNNTLSDAIESDPALKKPKVLRIAGVPTGEGEDENQVFGEGLGSSERMRPSQLPMYPGRTNVLLNVQELMGPSILYSLCQEGINIELVVRNIRWPRQSDGRPYQSEVEALTIGRILHFHFSKCTAMEEGILAHPWTEIALRRLWALLEVQSLTSGPSPLSRDEAWHHVLSSLEVYPDVGIRVPAMRTLMNRQVSAASRARNAVRSLARRPQVQNPKSQKRRQDGNREEKH